MDKDNPVYYAKDNVLFTYDGDLVCYATGKTDSSYTVPSGIKQISWYAFEEAENLQSVTLPDSVEHIGRGAFFGCVGLMNVTLPESVKCIEEDAFFNCTHLAKLVIPASAEIEADWSLLANVEGAVIFSKEGSDAQRWAEENGYMFHDVDTPWKVSGVCGEHASWKLSEDGVLTISGNGPMKDYDWAQAPWIAYSNMIRKVIVSEGVSSVGTYAFYRSSNLTNVSLPDSLTSVEENAFSNCDRLKRIVIPENVTDIGVFAFSSCHSLERILIPGADTHLDIQVFEYCDDFTLCCMAGSYAEQYAGWNDIDCDAYDVLLRIPASAEVIGAQAFAGVGPALVCIPDCVSEIEDGVFDEGTVIVASYGSYAEDWAEDNGFVCMAR